MKSIHGRGMARGYTAGRARRTEINRMNAEPKDHYIARKAWGMEVGGLKAHEGAMGKTRAEELALVYNRDRNDGFIYGALPENLMIISDPEGVARLKANPKL